MMNDSPAAILYDASGNPVTVTAAGGGVYRLQSLVTFNGNQPTSADIPASGTISALNGTVQVAPVGCSGASLTITGTWVGTLVFEATVDGTNWFSLPVGGAADSNVYVDTTTNGNFRANVASILYFRVRASVWSSGSASVAILAGQGSSSSASSMQARVEGKYPNNAIAVPYPVVMGGIETAGNIHFIATDALGRIITAPAGTVSTAAGFKQGYVATALVSTFAVRARTYTEQTSNAQRSISSANAADAAAGTGARQVVITYLDATGAGPYTETVTLNGTTPVNTVATDICFIESIIVTSVGSGGVNAGIITLYSATAGGGVAVWSIAAGDNRTFGAHHYTPVGLSTYVTGISVGHNGTTTGSGGVFFIRAKTGLAVTVPDIQVSDFIRLYGQSSTISRIYGTAIKIPGPARIVTYVTTESSTSLIFRAAVDYYDQ